MVSVRCRVTYIPSVGYLKGSSKGFKKVLRNPLQTAPTPTLEFMNRVGIYGQIPLVIQYTVQFVPALTSEVKYS